VPKRRNGCRGKVRHRSQTGAIIAAKKMRIAGLTTYPCAVCGGWHVGTSNRPDKILARLNQLLKEKVSQ